MINVLAAFETAPGKKLRQDGVAAPKAFGNYRGRKTIIDIA